MLRQDTGPVVVMAGLSRANAGFDTRIAWTGSKGASFIQSPGMVFLAATPRLQMGSFRWPQGGSAS